MFHLKSVWICSICSLFLTLAFIGFTTMCLCNRRKKKKRAGRILTLSLFYCHVGVAVCCPYALSRLSSSSAHILYLAIIHKCKLESKKGSSVSRNGQLNTHFICFSSLREMYSALTFRNETPGNKQKGLAPPPRTPQSSPTRWCSHWSPWRHF